MTTIAEALRWALDQLKENEQGYLESQILLAYVLKCDRVKLMAWPQERIASDQELHFQQLVQRRASHEPIAYLIGEKEFWSHRYIITSDVLVPRPETERLVEVVLEKLPAHSMTVLDMGTGSGVIACTLALMRPSWHVFGLDLSERALEIAKINSQNLQIKNITFLQSDWFSNFKDEKLDAIISNPPYLRADDPHLDKDLLFEPRGALVSGETGLEAFEKLIEESTHHLKPGGSLIFEHGYEQAQMVKNLLLKSGYCDICTFLDLSKHPRVSMGTYSK